MGSGFGHGPTCRTNTTQGGQVLMAVAAAKSVIKIGHIKFVYTGLKVECYNMARRNEKKGGLTVREQGARRISAGREWGKFQ